MSEVNIEAEEREARNTGWVDKDEWVAQGKPEEQWRDAVAYNEVGRQRDLHAEIKKLKGEVAELRTGNEQFRDFHEQTLAKERKRKENAIAELEAVREKAVTDGDGKAFREADQQLAELKAAPEPQKQSNGQESPTARSWRDENPAYGQDKAFTAAADGIGGRIQDEILKGVRPRMSEADYYQALTTELKDMFPDKYENPARQTEKVESEGKPGGALKGKKDFDSLPEEAKEVALMFERTHKVPRDTYAEQYWRDQE